MAKPLIGGEVRTFDLYYTSSGKESTYQPLTAYVSAGLAPSMTFPLTNGYQSQPVYMRGTLKHRIVNDVDFYYFEVQDVAVKNDWWN